MTNTRQPARFILPSVLALSGVAGLLVSEWLTLTGSVHGPMADASVGTTFGCLAAAALGGSMSWLQLLVQGKSPEFRIRCTGPNDKAILGNGLLVAGLFALLEICLLAAVPPEVLSALWLRLVLTALITFSLGADLIGWYDLRNLARGGIAVALATLGMKSAAATSPSAKSQKATKKKATRKTKPSE